MVRFLLSSDPHFFAPADCPVHALHRGSRPLGVSMGICVDLQLLRRGRRIIRNYLRQGQVEAHLDAEGQPDLLAMHETVDWCSSWLSRRTGQSPSDHERKLLLCYLANELRSGRRMNALQSEGR